MKRLLLSLFVAGVFIIGVSPSASASSFLSISVSVGGGPTTTVTCNNSAAACGALGFTSALGSNDVTFNGTVNGVTFGNANFDGIVLTANQPGNAVIAFSTDTKTAVANTNALSAAITVSFASNNFALPAGSPLTLQATQTVNNVQSLAAVTENFTGYGDASNSLVPGTGVADITPVCTTTGGPGTSCSTNAVPTSFARIGNFALNGIEQFTLNGTDLNGGVAATASFTASVNATPTAAVPEPTSVLLFGSGMLILVARKWRNAKRAK